MLSGLFFFGTLFLYDIKKDKNPSFLFLTLLGFLICLSFYFRFQIGLAITGFGIWFLLFEKKYAAILPLILGFSVGFIFNTYLDYLFYNELVFTPVRYFDWNIILDKASEYGRSGFIKYIALLIAVITVPPFSLILFYYGLKTIFKRYSQPVIIPVVLFILGHCLIGHKEDRFLYPVFSSLPIIVGLGIPELVIFYTFCKKWIAFLLKTALIFTIILNTVVLILFTTIPYSQTIYFSKILKNKFNNRPVTIYSTFRTPFETKSGIPMAFYKKGTENLEFIKISDIDSFRNISGNNVFITTTFNESKYRRPMFDSLGYIPVVYSSKILWNINEFLFSKNITTINDAWILYKKE
jgi:phosphatidylinositol glycan class B